jgi:hypothetical protein
MNQKIQLYIENEQVDVFQDGSINIVSSIKDFRSPDKIFTEFSRNFSLPASSRNNKVFKHFYDYDIVEGGFDARSAKEARIEINDRPFREGYITLDSVDIKFNKPSAYKVTFYGNLRTLKELFNNLKLTKLSSLDNFEILNKAYDASSTETFYDYLTNSKDFLDPVAIEIGTADGVKKTFQLLDYNPYPRSTSEFKVYLSNVLQNSSDYTYNGVSGTITFTSAPSSGTLTTKMFYKQPVVVPLISTTERLYYSSNTNFYGQIADGNLYYNGSSYPKPNGLKYEYLKPAIRVHEIIRAIEKEINNDSSGTVNIEFSNDFFNTANLDYYNLYMWLNTDVEESSLFSSVPKRTKVNTFTVGSYYPYRNTYNTSTSVYDITVTNSSGSTSGSVGDKIIVQGINSDFVDDVECTFYTSTTNTSSSYSVDVLKDGVLFTKFGSGNGSRNLDFRVEQDGEYEFVIITDDSVAIDFDGGFSVQFMTRPDSDRYEITDVFIGGGQMNGIIVAGTGKFSITKNMPDMTIIEFLSGLFKMFNLVCYVEGDLNTGYTNGQSNTKRIRVMTFDAYYSSSNAELDITDKIDTSTSSVKRVLPYSQIEFKYEDTESILANQHKNEFGLEWGGERWNAPESRAEKKYEIKVPFGHMKFERLKETGQAETDIQVGYSIKKGSSDKNVGSTTSSFHEQKYNPHIGKPVLFYPHLITSGTSIPYTARDTSGTTVSQSVTPLTSYFIPLNSVNIYTSQSNHFGLETDEYRVYESGETSNVNNLFNLYYKNYITHLFDIKSRTVNLKANLTNAFLSKFSLADKIRVSGKTYSINKIDVDLLTGKSNLELQRYYSIKSFSCLSGEFNITVETTSAGNIYYFDNKYGAYQMGQGTYVLQNIPVGHPIAFHNFGKEDRISYTGTNSGGTKAGLDGNTYTYYYGTVTVTVSSDFGTISYECYNHGYMGGEDNLIYNADCVAESSPIAPPVTGTLTVDATDIYADSGIITADQTDE